MSKTIDERVLEMRFDNRQFESGVSTTMSTLDKLKQKLQFKDSAKGLEDVSRAAQKVDLSSIGKSAETVGLKFNAMYTIADQALRNITNSAMMYGKQIVSALTIDPVKTGLSEYETKVGAIQVIKANTRSKYDSEEQQMSEIERVLSVMNDYADRTIYNYTQMTDNLGKFVNQGLDLDEAANAVMGLANLAGASGASAQDMARATYQMSQAMGGVIRKIDWNSLRNANMAGTELKNVLTDLARVEGIDIDGMLEEKGVFEETLEKGWLTGELFTKAMNIYSDVYSEAELKAMGFNDAQVKNFKSLAQTAREATTEVKTFSQLWDVLKETAQSGWTQTWEAVFGDFNTAKKMFTQMQVYFSDIINKFSATRNFVINGVLNFSKPWTEITDKLKSVQKVVSKVKDVAGTLEYFQDVVDRVWNGDFNNHGDNPDRRDLLEAAGYNERVVQYLVNLGEEAHHAGKVYKLTMEDIEAAHKKYGVTLETTTEETEAAVIAFNELTEQKLKDAGLTEDEIALYYALEKEAARLGITMEELAEKMSTTSGRSLLIGAIKNAWSGLVEVLTVAKNAMVAIFEPPTSGELIVRLYGMLESLHEFSKGLTIVDKETGMLTDTGMKLQSIFRGIFAAIDIVLTVIGGPLKIALSAAKQLLGFFGLGFLDVGAFVGDALVKLRDFIDGALDFTILFEKVVPPIQKAIQTFRNWLGTLAKSENLPQDIAKGIVSVFDTIGDSIKNFVKKIPEYLKQIPELISGIFDGSIELPEWMKHFEIVGQVFVELGKIIKERVKAFLSRSEFAGISGDAIAGLIQGLKDGTTNVWTAAVEIFSRLVAKVKEFLGIHSPSTVFAAIGGFIIAGLIAGLKNGIPDSFGAFKDIFQPMLDWIKDIDFGAVIASVIGVFTAATTYKIASGIGDFVSAISAPIEGVGELMAGVGKVMQKSARPIAKVIKNTAKVVKSFSNILNSVAFNIKADAIKTLAESLVMLAAAIVVLTFIKPGKLWNAVGVVTVLALVLVGLAFAMSKMSNASASIGKDGLDIKGLSSGLTGIGIALLLIAATVKMIGSLKPEQAAQGFWGLFGVVTAIAVVFGAFGILMKGDAANNVDEIGTTFIKLGAALLLMAVVVKILGGMDSDALALGGRAIALLGAVIVGLMAATRLISKSKNVENIGDTILKIAAAIAIMAIVVKLLGDMDFWALVQGTLAVAAFGGIIVGLMAATKLITGSKNVDAIGGSILKIAAAIAIMAIVAKMLGDMDLGALVKGTIAIAAFGGIIVGLMAATKLISGSKNVEKIGGAILAISGAIAIMAFTAFLLSMISWEGFAKGTIMITAFAGIIIGLIAATKLVGPEADKIGKTIISIAGAIGIIALIAVLLSLVPAENLKKGLLIITALSLIMAGLIAVTALAKNCMGTIITLTVMIGILAGALALLSLLPSESLIASTIALGSLLLVMAGVFAVLALLGSGAASALAGAAVMMVLGIVVAELAIILGVLAYFDVQPSIETASAISILLLSLSGVLVILTLIGPASTAAYPAMLALAVLIAGMAVLLGALGALMTWIPNAEEFLDKGIIVMEKIGAAIGAFVGGLIGGLAAGVMSTLPAIATSLSKFMTNLEPFIAGIKNVDIDVLAGAGILTAAILALTIADFITGIMSLGGLSLVSLGSQLSAFMIAAQPFIMGAKMIDPDMMVGVKTLAETILILTAADVLSGLTSWLTGGSSLSKFAAQLPILGRGLAAFSSNIGTFTEEQLATVNCAAQAVKTLAAAASEIPNTGGLLASIVGENDLSTFAAQFPILGTGLVGFLTNVGTFTEDQISTVDCAAQAIKTLASAASEIPNSGGWVGAIVGENDLGTFADQFPLLGTGLAGFLTNVGTFTEDQISTVDCAAQAIKALASAASEIPNSGGWMGAIIGDNDLGTFANQFPALGSGLSGFAANLGTFTSDQVTSIKASVSAIQALSGLANADLKSAKKHMSGFAEDLPGFGTNLKTFCTNMPSADSIKAAVSGIKQILSAVESISNTDSEVLWGFSENLQSLGANAVKKFIEAFTSNSAKTDVEKAGAKLGDKVIDGIESKESSIKTAGKNAAKKAVSGAETQKDEMKSAGKDLGKGLVSGIEAKWDDAYDAGYTLGEKAVQGEKDGQQSKSPSKLTIQAGKWLGEGLIVGMSKMTTSVYDAGRGLGKAATGSLSSTISRISDAISTDIDAQPTIRPVLDLSDVRSGAGAIGDMLGGDASIGVLSNVGTISTMMNRRNQNGGNDDVISALDRLGKKMDNINNASYHIDGVTYDDGSNISDAVKTIVRAAKMGRRV